MPYGALSLHDFFFFFDSETPLKDFPFYSPIRLTFWFRYLQTCIKESCIYLSSHFSSKLIIKLRNSKKNPTKCIFQRSADIKFKNFPFGVYHGATPQSHWTKQTAKKLILLGKTAAHKSAWIKACTGHANFCFNQCSIFTGSCF